MQDSTIYYAGDEPAIGELRKSYSDCLTGLDFFFEQSQDAYEDRRCIWPGKTKDLRKHGKDAFPWDGASDNEAQLINEKISAYVSLLMFALRRANIRAYGIDMTDAKKARAQSAFFKWLRDNNIRDFYAQAERCANYWLEKGLMITHVGWESSERTFLETVTLQALAEQNPGVAELIADPTTEAEAAMVLQESIPTLKAGRAKKVVQLLRETGEAPIPFSKRTINRPQVEACSPDGDVFFPAWCVDPQRSPYVFFRTFMTPQEIEQKVKTDGWNHEWAEYAIEHLVGVDSAKMVREYASGSSVTIGEYTTAQADVVEIVYAYQRLIDEEDGAEGIYRTVFCPTQGGPLDEDTPDFAKHELLSGMDEYPLITTRLVEDQKRIYDLQNFADLFRGTQKQVKTERDGRTDRSSMATLPPIWHGAGRKPKDYGPGRFIPVTREGELGFAPTPPFDTGSMEIEMALIKQSDRVVGLDPEDPDSAIKKQFFVDKFLEHWAKVLKLCEKQHRRYGDPRVNFRVTGYAEQQTYEADTMGGDPDLIVTYDVLNNDPETIEKKLAQLTAISMQDRYGKINQEALIEFAVGAIDPVMADSIIMSKEDSTQKILEDVTDRLAKAYAGIDIGAGKGGAEVALQAIQKWAQEPDVAERLQNDEAFTKRIQNIGQQYQFQITQAQNAEIGKLGGTPSTFQGVK